MNEWMEQELYGVYLGVRTCEIFLCFGAIVFLLDIALYFVVLCCLGCSLLYLTGDFHRCLQRG